MLRVACKCGKTLGVTDDFAGKQVRCPACLTVVSVPGPAVEDPPATPHPAPLLPAPRRRSPLRALVLLFGAGTVVLLLLAGVAIGVLWWLKPWADRGPGTVYNPVAVKFHVPAKVGDQRKVSVTADYHSTKESKSDATTQTNRKTEKLLFRATIRTLAVDKDGRETRREIEIDEFTVTTNTGQTKKAADKGAVLYLDGHGPHATLRGKSGGVPPLARQNFPKVQVIAFEDSEVTEDQLFGTDQKQVVANTWPVNKQAFVKWSQPFTPSIGAEAVSGNGKLVAAPKEGEAYFLDFEMAGTVNLDTVLAKENPGGKATGKAQFTWTARYPADYSTGPLRRSLKVEINVHETGSPKQSDATHELAITHHFTQETTYLPPAQAPDSPNPGRAGAVLDVAKVKRSPVSNEVQWSFSYSLPRDGSAKGRTWYAAVEFKGSTTLSECVDLGKRDGLNMESEGEWSGQLKLAEPLAERTPFVLYVSDEPLVGTEQRRQASQIQGVVE